MNTQRKIIAIVIAAILAVPALFDFPWTGSDFVVAAILLLSTGISFDVVSRRFTNHNKRIAVSAIILLTAIYIWAELAVGIFTNIGS